MIVERKMELIKALNFLILINIFLIGFRFYDFSYIHTKLLYPLDNDFDS